MRNTRFFEPMNRCDIGVIQRGKDLGFTLEASEAVGIEREFGGQDFQRDVAIQSGVARPIDLAHTAHAKQAGDFVSPESSAASSATRIRYAE